MRYGLDRVLTVEHVVCSKGWIFFAYASILSGFGVSYEAKSLKEVQMLISC